MDRRHFGATRRDVPVIGQGTWQIDAAARSRAVAALRRGLDLGMTHVDTAEMYGEAEPIAGQAITGRRDEVFLVSKVLPEHATRSGTVAACERSLVRLRTAWLDCYLLHWRGAVPLEETVDAFVRLEEAGKILSWGVSNFDVADLEEIAKLAPRGRPVCNQVLYHLRERGVEHAVIPWCAERGVAVVGYSPFGSGDFPEPHARGGRVLARIAEAHGATPRQVALAFLVREPHCFTIPKAGNPAHAEENAGAGRIELSPEEIASIDAAFPRGPKPRELPTL
jgi:diketogulonate reductase-like aldo/keto reductase